MSLRPLASFLVAHKLTHDRFVASGLSNNAGADTYQAVQPCERPPAGYDPARSRYIGTMKITEIVGTSSDQERKAVRELLATIQRGEFYPEELLRRLPKGRVEVHVASDANDGQLAVIIIEDGRFSFNPLEDPDAKVAR